MDGDDILNFVELDEEWLEELRPLPIEERLMTAVRDGRIQAVAQIIDEYGLSYSPQWSHGYDLLSSALRNGWTEVAKLLLTKGAKVNIGHLSSATPLHYAALRGDLEIVQMMVERGADVNAKNKRGSRRTPLHIAIDHKRVDVAEFLLKHGASVNAKDCEGKMSLHVAVQRKCIETVKNILKYDVQIDSRTSKKKQYAPLHMAAQSNLAEILKLLIEKGADINIKAKNGSTPLHLAALKGHCSIAEDLLSHSADINARRSDGITPLLVASKNGCASVVELLLQRGAAVNDQDRNGRTTLHLAVKIGCFAVVECILKYSPEIENESGKKMLRDALEGIGREYDLIVNALVEHGLTLSPEDVKDPKLLDAAVEKGNLKIFQQLLPYTDNLVGSSLEERYTALLFIAVQNRREELAKLLIGKANVNAEDIRGRVPIAYAAHNTDLKMTKLLLSHGACVKGNPYVLHWAVRCKENAEVCAILFNEGADVNGLCGGTTALHVAAVEGFDNYVEMLLAEGANVDCKSESGATPLLMAAYEGYDDIIRKMIQFGTDTNSKDKLGRTALHYAAAKGHTKVIEALLEHGADINIKSSETNPTPFDLALNNIGEYGAFPWIEIARVLKNHAVKLRAANFYVCEEYFQSLDSFEHLISSHIDDDINLEEKCKKEVVEMREKISDTDVTFYDILAKHTNIIARYFGNENVINAFKSDDYQNRFPLYSNIMRIRVEVGMRRRRLLDRGVSYFDCLTSIALGPPLPLDCTENIFDYLSNANIRAFIFACKSLGVRIQI